MMYCRTTEPWYYTGGKFVQWSGRHPEYPLFTAGIWPHLGMPGKFYMDVVEVLDSNVDGSISGANLVLQEVLDEIPEWAYGWNPLLPTMRDPNTPG